MAKYKNVSINNFGMILCIMYVNLCIMQSNEMVELQLLACRVCNKSFAKIAFTKYPLANKFNECLQALVQSFRE